ncbi:HNH endonuclease signature motif containing protein [Streptomyces sp. H39-S7]|uniref:HNH endonuclease signature motif containing protein n=1 Tax=Streptomyces sp. H39-S7 TaxID=3004357 RepID=UPI0022AFEBA4|nr:HNH endonuclease signature motif containing protein [Streptomyces sp. H39-S7]MCZ4118852.1 HNH endonuclease signature motif containing protein [Streptomyces sp. H39-S7]
MSVRYTHALLAEAARETTSLDEAVRWCGGDPTPGSRSYLRTKMAQAGIDISHFTTRRVRHTEEILRELVASSRSVAEVVRRLGINPVGGNQAHIGRRIIALGLDTSHFSAPSASRPKRPTGDRLVLGTPADGRISGERLRRELSRRAVPEICTMCGVGTEWNGKPLRLEVDHVDGSWWDNRPENLRLLCPNCHAVTDTYRGRKRRATA